MFQDFDLGGFMSGLNNTVSQYGNIKNSINNIDKGSQNTTRKYEQIQQKSAPTPTATTLPIDNKMLIYGGAGLVVLILLLKR